MGKVFLPVLNETEEKPLPFINSFPKNSEKEIVRMASKKNKKPSPLDILNRVRDKARLDEKPYQQIQVVKMKAGKIKFQLLALNDDFLFLFSLIKKPH